MASDEEMVTAMTGVGMSKFEEKLDWLTVTSKDSETILYLERVFKSIAGSDGGMKARTAFWSGRRARVGDGTLTYGDGQGWSILVASGEKGLVEEVYLAVKDCTVNCTRVDLNTTLLLSEPYPEYLSRLHCVLREIAPTKRLSLFLSGQGGSEGVTLGIGSRANPRYLRIYDKGIELGNGQFPKGQLYTFEVEYKQNKKQPYSRQVFGTPDLLLAVGKTVSKEFLKWGIVLPAEGEGIETSSQRISVSNEARLSWLSSSVKPPVKELLADGLLGEALIALGLEFVFDRYDEYRPKSYFVVDE